MDIPKMSTGQDSTLRNWIEMAEIMLGKNSKAVAFLKEKAQKDPDGLDAVVIANEGQLVHVLLKMHIDETN